MPKFPILMVIPPLIFAAIAALFLFGNFREDRDALPSTMIGRQAPIVELGTLAEFDTFQVDQLADGEVKVVNFWASWCPPCRAEHPLLEELAADGLAIYGVNSQDQPAHALAFLEELGNPYRGIGTSRDGRANIEWGVYGLPETFVVDGDGVIVLRIAGPVTRQNIERQLLPAVEEARSRL